MIIVEGLSEVNIDQAVLLREMIKKREDDIRIKRQQLDVIIYNNIKLLQK